MPKNNKNANIGNKCVIYARYSCHNQTEQSIEGQMHDCERYADANGLQIVNTYIDRAMTATSDRRPQFQQMIKDSALGMFDTILVWKLDRFARNRYDSAVYKRQLRSNGVTVVSVMEHITDSPEGVLMESVLEGFAEYFSRDLSQKVIRGMRETAQRHKITNRIPFGYCKAPDGTYMPDPETVPAVRMIFNMYNSGAKKCEIADWLNNHGYKTSYGNEFVTAGISRILQNSRYTGRYTYSDIEIKDEKQRIISDDTFRRAQLTSNARSNVGRIHRSKGRYILANRLYCGYCGNRMNGECGHSSTGKIYYYYACIGRKKLHICHRKNLNKEFIENYVINAVAKLIGDPEIVSRIADAIIDYQNANDKTAETLSVLTNKLGSIIRKITNLMNAIEDGIVTPTTKQRLKELEAQRAEVEGEIAAVRVQRPKLTKDQLIRSIKAIDLVLDAGDNEKYTLVQQLIKKIFVWEDKMVMIYNFTDTSLETVDDLTDDELIEEIIEKAAVGKRSTTAAYGTPIVSISEQLFLVQSMIITVIDKL